MHFFACFFFQGQKPKVFYQGLAFIHSPIQVKENRVNLYKCALAISIHDATSAVQSRYGELTNALFLQTDVGGTNSN